LDLHFIRIKEKPEIVKNLIIPRRNSSISFNKGRLLLLKALLLFGGCSKSSNGECLTTKTVAEMTPIINKVYFREYLGG